MRKILFFSTIFLFLLVKPAQAIIDPRLATNNRFGIHVLDYDDLKPAADLVNSTGGQWGYVTLVMRENDRNKTKWQPILDQCRQLKLIPIIRLATTPVNDYWTVPNLDQLDSWVNFLNSLNWVVQNRYLILFNEPNHKKEWGNTINPNEYVKVVKAFHQALKQSSADYFILPAGFDTAAPDSKDTMEATTYWSLMEKADPDIFKIFDGWNSHSYPNPGFSGPVTGSGFGTLKSYQAEINFLNQYGISANIPVFITETGWIHQAGKVLGASTENQALSKFYQTAFQTIWTQSNLIAVTPFVLNYPQAPFSDFAWQKPNTAEFYPHYYAVKDLVKVSGRPAQISASQVIHHDIPDQLTESSGYQFSVTFKNTGQSIWDQTNTALSINSNLPEDSFLISSIENPTPPFSNTTFSITVNTPAEPQPVYLNLQLQNQTQNFGDIVTKNIEIIPPPSIIVKASRFLKSNLATVTYKLLIYDQDQNLKKELPISLKKSISQPIKLYNLVPQNHYRFVLLKPHYLPRQVTAILDPIQTTIQFKKLLLLDFNQDGHFSIKDILSFFTHPIQSIKILASS